MAEIGRKGGSRKTAKQKENLVKATNASRAVRSAQAIGRKAQIQELKNPVTSNVKLLRKWVLVCEP